MKILLKLCDIALITTVLGTSEIMKKPLRWAIQFHKGAKRLHTEKFSIVILFHYKINTYKSQKFVHTFVPCSIHSNF